MIDGQGVRGKKQHPAKPHFWCWWIAAAASKDGTSPLVVRSAWCGMGWCGQVWAGGA